MIEPVSGTLGAGLRAKPVDVQQIIYALERAARDLEARADRLMAAHDYSAEFPFEDAQRMHEAIALLRGLL